MNLPLILSILWCVLVVGFAISLLEKRVKRIERKLGIKDDDE